MSIEKKIEDLINALDRNTAALNQLTGTKGFHAVANGIEIYPVMKDTEKIIEKVALEPITKADEVKPDLKYEDMVTAFRQFIGKNGRDKAAEILAKFGITGKLTADQLPESKYQEFLDALK